MSNSEQITTVIDNISGPRTPARPEDIGLIERKAHLDLEVIAARPTCTEAFATFAEMRDVARLTHAKIFGAVGKQTSMRSSPRRERLCSHSMLDADHPRPQLTRLKVGRRAG